MEGPLRDAPSVHINNVINVDGGSCVSVPVFQGNKVEGDVSNSTKVKESDSRRRTKENSEPDTAGPPSKRARSEVCGYVHEVGQLIPVGSGAAEGERRFTVRMQTDTGMVLIVVFNQRSHQAFHDAQAKKLAMSLKDVHFGKSKNDLIFGQTSKLSFMQSLDFEYDGKINEPKTVASVLECLECSPKQLITVTGKITDEILKTTKDIQGQSIMMTKFQLADNTADITLTVWGDKQSIILGRWYTFSCVKVKTFLRQKELTFTPYTDLTEVPSPENKADVYSSKNIRKWKVVGARVENRHRCICGADLPLMERSCSFVKCSTCKNSVLAQSVSCTTVGSITVQKLNGQTTTFPIPKSSIKSLLDLDREGFCDIDEAEEKLLQMTVEVVFVNGEIIEIRKAIENTCQD